MKQIREADEAAFLDAIGERIRSARQRLNLSQTELARRTGKTQNLISRYEHGQHAMRISELRTLANALAVPITYFFDAPATDEQEDLMRQILAYVEQLSPPFRQSALQLLQQQVNLQQQLSGDKN